MKDLAPLAVAALDELARELRSPADIDRTVHATRKGIKRLRAFVRLARKSIGTSAYRVEDGDLRSAARILAPARDALVLVGAAHTENAAPSVTGVLERAHAAAVADLELGGRQDAVSLLAATAIRWKTLDWHGPSARSVRNGLSRTYRRGRTDLKSVRADATDAAFHGWRRRVKYVGYQLEAISTPGTIVVPFTELGRDLGLEHDHTVLIGVCGAHIADAAFRDLAQRSIRRREELRARVVDLGSRLFAPPPDAFVADIRKNVDLG